MVPPNPQTISVNISAINLETADGAIPDAFELSLLASDYTSLVPTHRPGRTSTSNASAVTAARRTFKLAAGVRYENNVVTVDISSLLPGSQVMFND